MKYSIPIKKLKSIANPFEQAFLPNGETINITQVENFIKNNNIFDEDNETPEVIQWTKRIAYEIVNKESKNAIVIDLNNLSENQLGWIVTHGIEKLAAAIYNNEETVDAEVMGDEKTIRAVLGKTIKLIAENSDYQQVNEENNKLNFSNPFFNWKIDTSILAKSWGDKEYVLKKIKENPQEAVQFAIHELWLDIDFLDKCIEEDYKIVKLLPLNIIQKKEFIEYATEKDKSHVFKELWTRFLKEIYEKPTAKTLKIKEIVDKKVFDNPEVFIDLLSGYGYSYDRSDHSYLKYATEQTLLSPKIVDKLYEISARRSDSFDKIELSRILPNSYFKDFNNVKRYLHANPKKYISEFERSSYDFLIKDWIGDKEKVLAIVNDFEVGKEFKNSIYKYMNKSFKDDIDIMKAFLMVSLNYYQDVLNSNKLKNNTELKNIYLTHTKDFDYLSKEEKFKITDSKLIQRIVSAKPDLLTDKQCPDSWKEDLNQYDISARYFYWDSGKLPKSLLKKYYESTDLLKRILENDDSYEIFDRLPEHIRKNESLVLTYLNREKDVSWKLIPSQLWSKKSFCLKALEINSQSMKCIPQGFLNQKSFLLELCKEIDSHNISIECFNYTKKEIKQFFDSFEIEIGNYENFMTSYFSRENLLNDLDKKSEITKPMRKKI